MGMRKKIASFIMASAMTFSAVSGVFSAHVSAEEIVYQGYDTAVLQTMVIAFSDLTKKSGNEEKVREYCKMIIREADFISAQIALAQVNYSKERTEENYDTLYQIQQTALEADALMSDAFYHAWKGSYKSVMEEVLSKEYISAFEDDSADPEEEQRIFETRNELLKRYNDTAYSNMSPDEKNLECARIYLELVKFLNSQITEEGYTYLDYAYMNYCRDYTPADISQLNDIAAVASLSAYFELMTYAVKIVDPDSDDLNDAVFSDNMDVVERYAGMLSDELLESAREVREKNLYITGGPDSEAGAYTTMLSYYNTAVIFQHIYGDARDLTAAAHEFGHLNAMRLNSISTADISTHNLDIAEVQSQGLEVLFTNFYGRIYGADAELYRLNQLLTLLSSVAAGFQGNEFESYVFEHADSMTPEDVVKKYQEIAEKYVLYSAQLYEIPHLFQSPGYYISYAVSALAALELWNEMTIDFDNAVKMYTDFTHMSMYDGTGFETALASAGFRDVLSPDFMLSDVDEFMEFFTSGAVQGDTDGNGTVGITDLIVLTEAVISGKSSSDKDFAAFDLNRDGAVNAADVVKMKKKLSV